MKGGSLLLIAAVALVGLSLASRANAAQQFTAYPVGLKLDRANTNLMEIRMILRIRIDNPTLTAIPVNGFNGVVQYQGNNFATFTQPLPQQLIVRPAGTTDVDVPIRLLATQSLPVIREVVGQLLSGQFGQQFTIVGNVASSGINIPFSQTVTLSV